MADKMYNPGICWLKILACFGVVNSHYGTHSGWWSHAGPIMTLPVPVFIAISIFMAYDGLKQDGFGKLASRMRRLIKPFFFWGVVYFVLHCITSGTFDVPKLLWQLTFGHSVCKPLYFLPLLLVMTLVAYGMSKCEKWINLVAIGLCVLSFFMQYSDLNYRIFSILPNEMSFPCGRFFEVLPIVSLSCLAAEHKWAICGLRKRTVIMLSVLWLLGALILVVLDLMPSCRGFTKQGLTVFVLSVAVCFSGIFVGQKMSMIGQRSWLYKFSGLMFGVYLSHMGVAYGFKFVFGQRDTIVEALLIFFVSVVVAWCMMKNRYSREIVK